MSELKSYLSELVEDGAKSGTVRTEDLAVLLSRLEQAEQAVERVREVLKAEAFDVREYVTYKAVPVEYIEEALDGGTRRLADQGLGDNLARATKNGDAS